jgi:hypothetical protein
VKTDPPAPPLDVHGFSQLGSPHEDLVGVRVFSPGWGTCWLGMKADTGGISLWRVTKEGRVLIDYDLIQAYADPMTDNVWIIFYRAHDDASFPVLRCTGEEPGAGYYVPPCIRQLLE